MDYLDQFSIPVSGLRDGLHGYDFDIGAGFFQHFEGSPIKEAAVKVHLDFDKRYDMYMMDFQLGGTAKTTCDRCLGEFGFPIEDEQSLLVKFDDKEWEEADVVYILRSTQTLNVARYIYEFIHLAIPLTKTHDDAGETCNPEMLRFLAEGGNETEDTPKNNPFGDALKGLNFEN